MRRNKLCPVPECELQTKGGKVEFSGNMMRKNGPNRLDRKPASRS